MEALGQRQSLCGDRLEHFSVCGHGLDWPKLGSVLPRASAGAPRLEQHAAGKSCCLVFAEGKQETFSAHVPGDVRCHASPSAMGAWPSPVASGWQSSCQQKPFLLGTLQDSLGTSEEGPVALVDTIP